MDYPYVFFIYFPSVAALAAAVLSVTKLRYSWATIILAIPPLWDGIFLTVAAILDGDFHVPELYFCGASIAFGSFALIRWCYKSQRPKIWYKAGAIAIMPAVLVGGALGLIAWAAGNVVFSSYLGIPYVSGAGEMLVFCAALAGAGLGFLWFNTYPAQVFMGDIGALALGAALGLVAVVVRQELVLFIMGGVFVVETVSVMIQVASYKMTGRRIFRMAPLHHHFELKGWAEPKVIVRFWIITVILVLVGLASLKIR